MPATPAARAEDLTKVYGAGDTAVRALDGVTASFAAGKFTAIIGPSGWGKSTLMRAIAGLDAATSGAVWIGDTALTAAENITLPLNIAWPQAGRRLVHRGGRGRRAEPLFSRSGSDQRE